MRSLPAGCCLALAVLSAPALACDASGAFGIAFGDKPGWTWKRLEGNEGSTHYEAKVPKPDPRFDAYQVRVDSATREIFEITAIKIITPAPKTTSERLSPAQQADGNRRSREFAQEQITRYNSARRVYEQDRYESPTWTARPSEFVIEKVSGFGPWDARLSCLDVRRENQVARRVLPELFQPSAPRPPSAASSPPASASTPPAPPRSVMVIPGQTPSALDAAATSAPTPASGPPKFVPGPDTLNKQTDPRAQEYLTQVSIAAARILVYPPASERLGETGVALIEVNMDRSAQKRVCTIVSATLFPRLDEAALQACRDAAFPPVPDYLRPGADSISFVFRLRFKPSQ